MITLRLNSFSKEEVENLISVLDECVVMIDTAFCKGKTTCKSCENKHLCYAVEQALNYATEYQKKKTR